MALPDVAAAQKLFFHPLNHPTYSQEVVTYTFKCVLFVKGKTD